jgi:hypothetical protein
MFDDMNGPNLVGIGIGQVYRLEDVGNDVGADRPFIATVNA